MKEARGPSTASRKLTHRPNRVFELVRAIFRWAIGRDMIIINPTAGLQRPIRKEKPRERELSTGEIRVLWLALQRAPRSREKWKRQLDDFPMRKGTALTMLLALVTAQRIGEVSGIALTELDLNPAAPVWKIPGARTKNGEAHRVPLSNLALRLIEEARVLAGDSLWLFPNPSRDGPVHPHAATRALERARTSIGLDDFRVHDLRRTAATRMEELGTPPHVISHVLNHISVSKSTITKKVYSRYTYEREKRATLNAWGTRLEEIVAGTQNPAGLGRTLRLEWHLAMSAKDGQCCCARGSLRRVGYGDKLARHRRGRCRGSAVPAIGNEDSSASSG